MPRPYLTHNIAFMKRCNGGARGENDDHQHGRRTARRDIVCFVFLGGGYRGRRSRSGCCCAAAATTTARSSTSTARQWVGASPLQHPRDVADWQHSRRTRYARLHQVRLCATTDPWPYKDSDTSGVDMIADDSVRKKRGNCPAATRD